MITNKYDGDVTNEMIYELLRGIMRNVRKQDDWESWVDNEEEWTDGKVYKTLKDVYVRIGGNINDIP